MKFSALLFQPLCYICCGSTIVLKVEQELSFPIKATKQSLVLALKIRTCNYSQVYDFLNSSKT